MPERSALVASLFRSAADRLRLLPQEDSTGDRAMARGEGEGDEVAAEPGPLTAVKTQGAVPASASAGPADNLVVPQLCHPPRPGGTARPLVKEEAGLAGLSRSGKAIVELLLPAR